MSRYDGIVIGAGHNGLVTAAILAKQGKRVCVLERRDVLGGCSVTEELWPGYKISTASYVVSLLLPEIIRDLKLEENGLKILPRNPSSFTPTLHDKYLMLGPDQQANRQEIAKFSPRDAERFPAYERLLEVVAEQLEPTLAQTAPDLLPLPASWRRVSLRKRLRDSRKAWQLHRALKSIGADIPQAIELLTGAARPILDRWFESDILKATLATDAVIGAFASISAPGTAYVLLHHVMGMAGGARGVWGYIEGGMGGLAAALAETCQQLGVAIKTESEVKSIELGDDGSVQGVTTADGEVIEAPVVASSVDANLTFLKFLEPAQLPNDFRQAVENIDYHSASLKINLGLGELPSFSCLPGSDVGPQHRGTLHICDQIEWLERAYDDAKYGEPSRRPILECTIPSSVDPSLAPEGKHVMNMFVQFAPYRLKPGLHWDDIKEDFGDRCVDLFQEFAPNFKQSVEHRQVLSPLDLERVYGLTGGNIFQGSMNLNQLFSFRPVPGWSDHRTPVKGLYLCGSAAHPGGGVMGACGLNAAREILRDRK